MQLEEANKNQEEYNKRSLSLNNLDWNIKEVDLEDLFDGIMLRVLRYWGVKKVSQKDVVFMSSKVSNKQKRHWSLMAKMLMVENWS